MEAIVKDFFCTWTPEAYRPKWWQAVAYFSVERRAYRLWIWPLNYAVALFFWISLKWAIATKDPRLSPIEKLIEKRYGQILSRHIEDKGYLVETIRALDLHIRKTNARRYPLPLRSRVSEVVCKWDFNGKEGGE